MAEVAAIQPTDVAVPIVDAGRLVFEFLPRPGLD
jgi:hypothetical protein